MTDREEKKTGPRGPGPDKPEPPAQIYRQDLQFTPFGTENKRVLTPEGRLYLAKLEAAKREAERDQSFLDQAPLVPRRAMRTGEQKKWEAGDLSDIFNNRPPPGKDNTREKDPDLEP